ncbi:MAG: monomeric [FeFe] hydrogenase [Candidatus Gastranaerophilales bacterium]|nr:monomeric [FeFe] hydrogenase [Candidatus Gastranaerophilales bacterium]
MDNSGTLALKQEVLTKLTEAFFSDSFEEKTRLIPYDMRPKGSDVPFRCCIYKERAILRDRVIADLGFSIEDDNEETSLSVYAKEALKRETTDNKVLTVIGAACKGCVPNRMYVTNLCQGCVARSCVNACKFGAINIVNGKSYIDSSKCKNCKMCMAVCPYNAIVKIAVPCEDACPVGAIEKDEHGLAKIDHEKCISCGRCVKRCPFGAINEKSQIIDILKHIKNNDEIIAMIAPSIAGQFKCSIYQLKTAMIKAGFKDVYEVAQGADITTKNEAEEFEERMKNGEPFMTTSCCAGYNELRKKHLNEINQYASDTKTPMFYIAEIVRKKHPNAKTVFVSPCVAKRKEVFENENVDYLMNYIELKALLDGKKINPDECEETMFEIESSKQGRNYGVTGGVAGAVGKITSNTAELKPYIINCLDKDTIKTLKKFAMNKECPEGNLIEVMCCEGGCIGGNAAIEQQKNAKKSLQKLLDNSSDIKKD